MIIGAVENNQPLLLIGLKFRPSQQIIGLKSSVLACNINIKFAFCGVSDVTSKQVSFFSFFIQNNGNVFESLLGRKWRLLMASVTHF